jgi:manganese-dependent inorganic pyrophosphatase
MVISYVNPDLDGVACCLAIEHADPSWTAYAFGQLNEETLFVLDALRLRAPNEPPNLEDASRVWLVDTHHLAQLPRPFPSGRVLFVTDHHPNGDEAAFPNAQIVNEDVGAAATLVGELLFTRSSLPDASIAMLLQAAILSNTLDLRAPATSARDHSMLARLATISALPTRVTEGMRNARRSLLRLATATLLGRDAKEFDTPAGRIVVFQFEAPGALEVLSRHDLREAIQRATKERGVAGSIFNLVDTEQVSSAVIVSNADLAARLTAVLGSEVNGEGVMIVRRILQRKTDIIPYLP